MQKLGGLWIALTEGFDALILRGLWFYASIIVEVLPLSRSSSDSDEFLKESHEF